MTEQKVRHSAVGEPKAATVPHKKRNRAELRKRKAELKQKTDDLVKGLQSFQEDTVSGLQLIFSALGFFDERHTYHGQLVADTNSYDIEMTTNFVPPFSIQAVFPPTASLQKWEPLEHVEIVVGNFDCTLMITHLEMSEDSSILKLVCPRSSMVRFARILEDCHIEKEVKVKFPARIKLSQRRGMQPTVYPNDMRDCNGVNVMRQMYCEKLSDEDKKRITAPKSHPPVDSQVRVANQMIKLTSDQIEAIDIAMKTQSCSVIQSSFGTGKTIVASLIAANVSRTAQKPVLLISQTNSAVAQLAKTLHSLDDFKNLNPVRLKSENMNSFSPILFDIYASTPIDVISLCRELDDYEIEGEDRGLVDYFVRTYEAIKNRVLNATAVDALPINIPETMNQKVDKLNVLVDDYYHYRGKALETIFKYRRPKVLCATVDNVLKSFTVHPAPEHEFLRDPEMIIIDEGSQLPEFTFLQLLIRFPTSRFCMIGDQKQLAPYSCAPSDSEITKIGRRSILNILVMQAELHKLAQGKLLTTFRCHPSLINLPNQLFYENLLKSGSSEESKSFVLNKMKFPNRGNPLAFIDVRSTHYMNKSTRSSGNDAERATCMKLLTLLLQNKCVESKNVSVVTLYKEQRIRLTEMIRKNELTREVRVNTVDSIQGAEYEIVILLTTKTNFSKKEIFFTNPNRINVAITRAKLAMFIIGHELNLRPLPVWGDIIRFCEKEAGIVKDENLSELF